MNSDLNLIIVAIGNELQTRFQFSHSTFQAVNIVITQLVTLIITYYNIDIITNVLTIIMGHLYYYRFIVLFCIMMVTLYKFHYNLYKIKEYIINYRDNYNTLNNGDISYIIKLQSQSDIDLIIKYMKQKFEFFDTMVSYDNINYGTKTTKFYKNKIYFEDTLFEVSGYILMKTEEKTKKLETEHNWIKKDGKYMCKSCDLNLNRYNSCDNCGLEYSDDIKASSQKQTPSYLFNIYLHIENQKDNKKSYLDNINEFLSNQNKYIPGVELIYYKDFQKSYICYTYYDVNTETEWEKDVLQLKDSYFSQNKNLLFNIIDIHNNDRQNMYYNNLLLHGEPGTGKSTMIYRFGTILKKRIFCIDLTLYFNRKVELYKLFYGQDNGDYVEKDNNTIFVLEEFDQTIDKLIKLEELYKQKQKHSANKMNSYRTNMARAYSYGAWNNYGMDSDDDNKRSKKYKRSKKSKKSDSDSEKEKPKEKEDDYSLNGYLKQTSDEDSNILVVGDLLELFQGPVPIKGRMIIATSNNYEKMREILPALFRPGRLTPIYFDYIDWNSFVELCNYYFNKGPKCESFKINLATSHLIELAISYKIDSNIESYIEKIKEIINEKKLSETLKGTEIIN